MRVLSLLVLTFVAGLGAGCTWRVIPPADVRQPTYVYVSEYGRHTRLALPQENQPSLMVEYGFGDWHFYALEERGPWSAMRALFWSPASALSKRELSYYEDPEQFRRTHHAARSVKVPVDAVRAADLRQRLEHRWSELGRTAPTVQRETGAYVRQSDETYRLWRNSNHRTAAWLRELGCEVTGVTVLSSFEVEDRGALPVLQSDEDE
jgi:hypothetical protein